MIKSISYSNANLNWHLDKISFDRLTLLVGASGVGKTRILYSIYGLHLIAAGKSLPGRRWECVILGANGEEYLWEGEFEKTSPTYDQGEEEPGTEDYSDDRNEAKVLRERLVSASDTIFSRDNDRIIFEGKEMPKLPSEASLVFTLKEEDSVRPLATALSRVVLSQGSKAIASEGYMFSVYQPNRVLKSIKSAEDIKKSSLRVIERLYATQQLDPSTFEDFKGKFREVFSDVEDLKLDKRQGSDDEPLVTLSIKEREVDDWIEHDKVSSGMLRTILHLAEIMLLPNDSVLLIDEFENSLGVNCIDVVTQEVLQASSRIQCVITSHHPYVINNIGFDHWRVVTRRGSRVSVSLPSDLGIGRSSHEKFLQLINSRSFHGG